MKNKIYFVGFVSLILGFSVQGIAQEKDTTEKEAGYPEIGKPFTTFKSTRIVNAQSIETLKKRDLEIRITHRFGDIGGNNGGHHTLWGIQNARDIRIAAEYGFTEWLTAGIGRSKGGSTIKEVYDGFLKTKLLKQNADNPFTVSYFGSTIGTTMKASEDSTSATSFPETVHRFSYGHQLLIGSRITDWLSLQLMPTYTHRNFVGNEDKNGLLAIGAGGVLKLSKMVGISGEYFYVFDEGRTVGNAESKTYNPVSLGVEIETGGHIFHINLSNSGGIGMNQFIPYTLSDLSAGQFRLGFTITRYFHL